MNRRIERASRLLMVGALTFLGILAGDAALRIDREACAQVAAGCAVGGEFITPTNGFDAGAFDFNSASVDTNGYIQLDTGATSLDPNSIVIPFEQDVYTTFLLEGAGYVSSIGWFSLGEAEAKLGYTLNSPLNFNSLTSAGVDVHYLFRSVEDQNSGCCDGGDGILNKYYNDADNYLGAYPGASEANLTTWGFTVDSSSIPGFVGANSVDPRDMKKYMARFAANTEIVYFLHPNDNIASTWYSKTALNGDTWNPSSATKRDALLIFDLSIPSPEQGGPATVYNTSVTPVTATQGFVPTRARDRLGNPDNKGSYPTNGYFDIQMSGTQSMQMTRYDRYSHFMLATPPNDPFKWILGVEDLSGGGDADFNDMMILIHRKTGGTAQLNAANVLSPVDPDAYITSASVSVVDSMPCDGMTSIRYYLSVNGGTDWTEITDWTVVQTPGKGGADVANWSYGKPDTTYREATINFMELGLVGRDLTWKAELVSELESCIPKIISFNLNYSAAVNTEFSRSSPVALGNVLYSSSYETPAATWVDRVLRGHLRSVEIYDPVTARDPAVGLSNITNWDAGQALSVRAPSSRNVLTPSVKTVPVVDELIATGDGTTSTFIVKLLNSPIVHSTVIISDGNEIFRDKHTADLEGSLTGTGTIDRFNGEITLNFNTPPGNGAQILANYTAYSVSSLLANFSAATNTELALDNSQVTDATGTHYAYDFNADGAFDDKDGTWLKNWVVGYRDGAAIAKEWPLAAIDHSTPAYAGTPGNPSWYYGADVTATQKETWDLFRCDQRFRPTKVYAGSQMGMLHSFYAGEYRSHYIDPTLFPPSTSCTATNVTDFKAAVNTLTIPDPITGQDVPIYPGPAGGMQIVINKGYYAWESSAGAPLAAPNYGDGSEDWAMVPTDQLPKLKNNYLSGEDHASVDASPTISYVQFSDDSWHAVIMAAEGNGGDHVFALDVTSPDNPTFLWDYADPDLFRSRSSPSVGVIGRINSSAGPKWVVFFVSGVSQDATLDPSIYMLDVQTGQVLSRIYLASAGLAGQGGTPSGQPAIVDTDSNGYIDRLYIGTDKGFVYKVNLPDSPTSSGSVSPCATTFFDAGQPIYASPAVVVKTTADATGALQLRTIVLFGTSSSPWQVDSAVGVTYSFYAVEDTAGKTTCGAGTELWSMALPPGQQVFASAFAAANRVYFGTTTAETEDPCAPPVTTAGGGSAGLGNLYTLDLETGSVIDQQNGIGNFTSAPLVDDQHLFVKTSDGTMRHFGGNTFQNQGTAGGLGEATSSGWREIL